MFRRTKGILSDKTDPKKDSDCIVTAMALGLFRQEYVGRRRELILGYDPAKAEPVDKETREKHRKNGEKGRRALEKLMRPKGLKGVVEGLNATLAVSGVRNIPPIKVKSLRAWQKEEYITGRNRGAGLPFSLLRKSGSIASETRSEVADAPETSGSPDGYKGRGAYTGVHALESDRSDDGFDVRYVGSTFRHYIDPARVDRWIPRDPEARPWGLIGGQRSLPGMKELAPDGESEDLVGYTHGMIQAIYSAACDGFKGDTIEVAVGDETTKLASCLACTTFMAASGRPPDGIHLGRGESWSPIYAETKACETLCSRRWHETKQGDMNRAVSYVNRKWFKKCAEWLYWGTQISSDCIKKSRRNSWRALERFARDNHGEVGPSAHLFLDALTISEKDEDRISRTLKGCSSSKE
ncbi:MAG: hypothetical protein AAF604_07265 [Acidobacteriota bacterium]